jgi:hypothetical protein
VLSGPVPATVAACAEDLRADVITVVSRGGWRRPWKRPFADQIAGATERPVCVTGAKAIGSGASFRSGRILCVLTLNGTDGPVLELADTLARGNGAELVLLNVVPEQSESLLAHGIARVPARPLSRRYAAQRMCEAARVISCPHTTAIVDGSPEASILRAVRECGAGLVVAARPLGYDTDPFSPNLRALFTRISCPVLCVPTQSRNAERGIRTGLWQRVSALAFRSHETGGAARRKTATLHQLRRAGAIE